MERFSFGNRDEVISPPELRNEIQKNRKQHFPITPSNTTSFKAISKVIFSKKNVIF
jgi:hypothetical protein